MEWLVQLQGQIVGLDTPPLIYFIEENPNYLDVTDAFFEAMIASSVCCIGVARCRHRTSFNQFTRYLQN
ncbi:MAG: hypothetical protein RMY36_004255 [Nostoc sp. SerVER01]|nr:hypothetical protein [Nostoc sp. SerVER01]MDZ8072517.1 hypothetical protein [Nostoc sp. DedQUE01]